MGDATGKGVPAAFVMSATCALLGGVATALSSSPGEVLSRVNEAVLTRIPPNMFITCFCAILDPKSSALSYANAGYDLPYVRVIARDLPPWEADRETSEARRSAPRVRENLRRSCGIDNPQNRPKAKVDSPSLRLAGSGPG